MAGKEGEGFFFLVLKLQTKTHEMIEIQIKQSGTDFIFKKLLRFKFKSVVFLSLNQFYFHEEFD